MDTGAWRVYGLVDVEQGCNMPTVLRIGACRFFFYANDRKELTEYSICAIFKGGGDG
jgi:hypothetical protein